MAWNRRSDCRGNVPVSYKLQVTSYKLQVTSYKLQVTSYKLQATSYKLQATSDLAVRRARLLEVAELEAEVRGGEAG